MRIEQNNKAKDGEKEENQKNATGVVIQWLGDKIVVVRHVKAYPTSPHYLDYNESKPCYINEIS